MSTQQMETTSVYLVRHKLSGAYLSHPGFARWERVHFSDDPERAYPFPSYADARAWAERHRPASLGGWSYSLMIEHAFARVGERPYDVPKVQP